MHAERNFHLSEIKLSDSISTTFKLRYRTNYDFIYNMYDQMREMVEAYEAGNEFLKSHDNYELIFGILGD